MKYFNGFSLKGEEVFFQEQLIQSDYAVAGFSYGAQKALEYAYSTTERIDRIILLSPAFFQNHKKSFIKTQLRYYKANQKAYTEQFLKNVASPSSIDLIPYFIQGSYEELNLLLSYVWDIEKIQELKNRGIVIEVFLGAEDEIVNSKESFAFFSELVNCYFIKNVGHLLQ